MNRDEAVSGQSQAALRDLVAGLQAPASSSGRNENERAIHRPQTPAATSRRSKQPRTVPGVLNFKTKTRTEERYGYRDATTAPYPCREPGSRRPKGGC